ncbi:MAG TPA: dihydrofolate reductase family protein [Bryobacteraceae bacterium]|nr:dihydrofolate reductase family protein [Bryobacteraceae bacterium]
MHPIQTLFERDQPAGPAVLPEDLFALYGGDLRFPAPADRPYVIANFVSTLDGVVSFNIPGKAGGGDISGFDEPDRFLMGLLRASADAVIVGAGTVQEVSPRHLWAAASIYRSAADAYARYRQEGLHKPKYPLQVVVTASGRADFTRAIFQTPELRTVVLTTEAGAERLRSSGAGSLPSTEVRAIGDGPSFTASAMLDLLRREFEISLLLHEGGPRLFGSFVSQGLVDESFLTIAPQLAGRATTGERPGMVEGIEFAPQNAPWLTLVSIKRSGDHLYLRYRRR